MPDSFNQGKKTKRFRKKPQAHQPIEELTQGVRSGNRRDLAKAITLIESNSQEHFQRGQELLKDLTPYTGKSIRIGITGVPGAGKSTFIETFGESLCEQGYKVAVLAVDPSSTVTGGSILGDKTRMENLSRNPNAFVRPSPSGGVLGGVHRKTRETMLLCEAAGYDVILVETVGVGQSEVIVRGMVDFFMLLVITGAGDELQGMKKGIMELADLIVVNKADGDNLPAAEKTRREYKGILHFLQPATKGWETQAVTCSALHGKGIGDIWQTISDFQTETKESGVFSVRRKSQTKEWLHSMISDRVLNSFFHDPDIRSSFPDIEAEVITGSKTASQAVETLMELYKK
ncbi:methylmalonyl Co-A mutase-associated GTPase MeaB [Rossellomorea vietnamensis]|uniref:Methylmalonyl Co-A mutase-associated GTPase MeaB n=1 Tax=Rossellomorea vietnamensis TaxID=218284 RepID=A0A5D4MG91_9BACI|nr:methylmalonyl Co-A mutase-associated GTPase MeaB [Rossellomorea vietnamensis]TYS00672.1 methylmalonyl Co-A mutase-associated GTPase MeaB [Rossellomorea vietnamensis]